MQQLLTNEEYEKSLAKKKQDNCFAFHRFIRDNDFIEIIYRNQWHSISPNYPNIYSEEELYKIFEPCQK